VNSKELVIAHFARGDVRRNNIAIPIKVITLAIPYNPIPRLYVPPKLASALERGIRAHEADSFIFFFV
jgi:hypothetical protein